MEGIETRWNQLVASLGLYTDTVWTLNHETASVLEVVSA